MANISLFKALITYCGTVATYYKQKYCINMYAFIYVEAFNFM